MKFIFNLLIIYLFSAACFGEGTEQSVNNDINSENSTHYNLILGLSPFLGVIGAEYQFEGHAIGIGYPKRISYRYFISPKKNSKYWGAYLGGMSYDDINETVDGVQYQELESEYIGIGIGYRWRWQSGWNANLSLALHYYDYVFTNPGLTQKGYKNGLFIFPGGHAGYEF